MITVKKSKKISLIFITSLFAIIFLYMFIVDYYTDKTRKEGVFRIATLDKIRPIPRNAQDWLIFKYSIEDKEYFGRVYILDAEVPVYKEMLGKRYVVRMNKNSFINKIFYTYSLLKLYPVPNDLKDAPSDGWKELPEKIRK